MLGPQAMTFPFRHSPALETRQRAAGEIQELSCIQKPELFVLGNFDLAVGHGMQSDMDGGRGGRPTGSKRRALRAVKSRRAHGKIRGSLSLG